MLITLGIVGFIAVIIVSQLVENINTRIWNSSSTVFEERLEQALKVMNTQSRLAGYSSTRDFLTELSKDFKIVKICDEVTECFEDKIKHTTIDLSTSSKSEYLDLSNFKTARDLGQKDWSTEALGVQFVNGVSAIVAYNDYDCEQNPYSGSITGRKCVSMIYDTDGKDGENESTKDVRGINSMLTGCAIKSGDVCFSAPFQPEPMSLEDCQKEVEKGVLGIRACFFDQDYWAGAVKECGKIENLPESNTQLVLIAKYIYNTDNISDGYSPIYTMDRERVNSLGFTNFTSGFQIWSTGTGTGSTALARLFYSYTRGANTPRNTSGVWAMCVTEE